MAEKPITFADLPNIDPASLQPIDVAALAGPGAPTHPPRILMLYGSLRKRSYSRFASEEAARLLRWFGAETRTFNPSGLPLPDAEGPDHPKVKELRDLATWAEGMVWCSPERHGAMTGIMKAQIDWLPLSLGGVRPTQGKTTWRGETRWTRCGAKHNRAAFRQECRKLQAVSRRTPRSFLRRQDFFRGAPDGESAVLPPPVPTEPAPAPGPAEGAEPLG